MIKVKSCAGCRGLFHSSNGGVHCYLRNPVTDSDEEVLDRRLDCYVKIRPVGNCKSRTIRGLYDSEKNNPSPQWSRLS